jgi:hypothetical protein
MILIQFIKRNRNGNVQGETVVQTATVVHSFTEMAGSRRTQNRRRSPLMQLCSSLVLRPSRDSESRARRLPLMGLMQLRYLLTYSVHVTMLVALFSAFQLLELLNTDKGYSYMQFLQFTPLRLLTTDKVLQSCKNPLQLACNSININKVVMNAYDLHANSIYSNNLVTPVHANPDMYHTPTSVPDCPSTLKLLEMQVKNR